MTRSRFLLSLFLVSVLWAPMATSLRAVSTSIVISEFRTRGTLGGNDEFVELHNVSNAAIDISGWKIRGSNAGGTVGTRVTINAGTTLGPGCFFLATNNAASGYAGSVSGNQTFTTGITDDGGLAVTLPDDTVVDAVGMSTGSAFKEGTTLTPTGANQDRGIERNPGGVAGHQTDSDNNANDFSAITPGNPQNLSSTCIEYGDGGPTISINDVSVIEGDAGQTIATFNVTASTDVHAGLTFDIAAVDGTGANAATAANNDFSAAPAVGSIAAGETTFAYSVAVLGDVTFEQNETYSVVLSNVSGAGVAKGSGIGTITNDDPAPPVTSDVVISQVYGGGGNAGATFTHDFIELFNRGSSAIDITGWSLQYVSAAGSGTWAVTPLTGTVAPGRYYLVQQGPGAGGTTALPAPDAAGTILMSATSGKVALQMNTTPISGACPSAGTADLVGYGATATCSETTPIDPATSNTAAALRKRGGCFDSNNNDVDFSIAPPTPRHSSTPATSCTATTVTISQIQGNDLATPFAGQLVATSGIVTATKNNGFFLQSPGSGDNDAATSDGLFVFTQSAPAVIAGHAVTVQGTATEFFQLTQVEASLPGDVTVQSTGNALPDAIALTPLILDAGGAHAQLERFEGMRVFAASLTSVAPTNDFGEIDTVITGVPRPLREPGISVFDPVPVDPSSEAVDCCIPRFDENPERIMIDTDALGLPRLDVTSHVLLDNVSGPLDFTFDRYKIALASTPMARANIDGIPVPAPAAGEFTIAGYNIENFTGGEPQLTKASLAIRQLMQSPDVIGHIEILSQPVLQALANRVNADTVAAGLPDPQYQAILIEYDSPEPGTNTQNVGFLVKTSRVRIGAYTLELTGDTFVDPGDGQEKFLHDRPPFVLRATFDYNGPNPTPAIVVVNHLRSFIDIELLTGDGPRVRAKRTAQAESVARLLQRLQTDNPGVAVVSLGDYNAFQFTDGYTDPISVLKGRPTPDDQIVVDESPDEVDPDYLNLTDSLPPAERYSFVFEGTAQALDHVLVNTVANQYVQRYVIARGNADFPESLYAADTTRPERSSDHDMPVAYFRFPDITAPVVSGVPADITREAAGPGGTVVTYTLPTAEDNTDGTLPVSCSPASGSLFPIRTTLVTCTATDSAGNSTSETFNVTVTDPRTAGAMSGAGIAGGGANSVTFAFDVRESGPERGHIVATLRQDGRTTLLISLRVDSVFFTNDGGYTPGPRPPSGIDTVVFSGPALYSLAGGYTYEARATDRGEPGRNDTFTLIVRNAAGTVVANVGGPLAAGNIQSRRVR